MMASTVKEFIDNFKKPFADLKLKRTAFMEKFLSVIDIIQDLYKRTFDTISRGMGRFKGTPEEVPAFAGGLPVAKEKHPPVPAVVGDRGLPVARELGEIGEIDAESFTTGKINAKAATVQAMQVMQSTVDSLVVSKLSVESMEGGLPTAGEKPLDEEETGIESPLFKKFSTNVLDALNGLRDEVVDFGRSLARMLLGPITGLANTAKNLALGLKKQLTATIEAGSERFRQFREEQEERIKQREHLTKEHKEKIKELALGKLDKKKREALLKDIEKHTGGMTKLQKAQMFLQTMLGTFFTVVQILLQGILFILAKSPLIALGFELTAAVAGALNEFWTKTVEPILPDWLKRPEAKAKEADYELARLKKLRGQPLTEKDKTALAKEKEVFQPTVTEKIAQKLFKAEEKPGTFEERQKKAMEGAAFSAMEKVESKKASEGFRSKGFERGMIFDPKLQASMLAKAADKIGKKIDDVADKINNMALGPVVNAPSIAATGGGGEADTTLDDFSELLSKGQ